MKAILGECMRTWRRLGVPRVVRREMAEELEADLATAATDGVRAEDFVAGDVRAFAETWAHERGAVKPRLLLGSTVAAAVIGLVPGAVFGLFAAYGMSSDAFAQTFGSEIRVGEDHYEMYYEPAPWLLLGLYGLGAVFAYAGAVCAVAAVLRGRSDQALARTVRALLTALPVGTVLAVAATIVFAWSRNFSTEAPVVIAEAVVALATFATVVAGVRVWSVRRERSRRRPFRPAVDAAVEPL